MPLNKEHLFAIAFAVLSSCWACRSSPQADTEPADCSQALQEEYVIEVGAPLETTGGLVFTVHEQGHKISTDRKIAKARYVIEIALGSEETSREYWYVKEDEANPPWEVSGTAFGYRYELTEYEEPIIGYNNRRLRKLVLIPLRGNQRLKHQAAVEH